MELKNVADIGTKACGESDMAELLWKACVVVDVWRREEAAVGWYWRYWRFCVDVNFLF